MSLINEALKKAQSQRATEPAPLPLPTSTATAVRASIKKRRPPLAARTLMGILSVGLLGLITAGITAYIYQTPESPTPPAAAHQSAAPIAPTATPPVPAKTAATAAPQPATVSFPPLSSTQLTADALPPTPAQPSEPAHPTANIKIQDFIDTLRISGIRASVSDPKVIINGQICRINDLIDRNLQVRLRRIESTCLVFTDSKGFEYLKTL
jgi:hypothetical protein